LEHFWHVFLNRVSPDLTEDSGSTAGIRIESASGSLVPKGSTQRPKKPKRLRGYLGPLSFLASASAREPTWHFSWEPDHLSLTQNPNSLKKEAPHKISLLVEEHTFVRPDGYNVGINIGTDAGGKPVFLVS
jgi:hypothetical protein